MTLLTMRLLFLAVFATFMTGCSSPEPDTEITGKLEYAMVPGGPGQLRLVSGGRLYVLNVTEDTEFINITVKRETHSAIYQFDHQHLVKGIRFQPNANNLPQSASGNPITIGRMPDGYVNVLYIEDLERSD